MLRPVKSTSSAIPYSEGSARPWWLWPNVLSLDAPLVAVVWQEAFGRAAGVDLSWDQRGLLALCAWLAYCGDRLLDARRLTGPVDSARHEFARVHAKPLRWLWGLGFVGATVLALKLSALELKMGVLLLAGVIGYFVLQHHARWRLTAGRWKELMVGVGFGLGTLFFVGLQTPLSGALISLGLAWMGLCALNCLLIAGWDRDRDAAIGQPSMARYWPGLRGGMSWGLGGVVGLAILAGGFDPDWWPMALVTVLAALGLWELARRPVAAGAEANRVWADAILLTPVLWLLM